MKGNWARDTGSGKACGLFEWCRQPRTHREGLQATTEPCRRAPAASVSVVRLCLLVVALVNGCAQTPPAGGPARQIQITVYFNNDTMSGHKTVCDAVFGVSRSVSDIANPASAALNALFSGPTPAEQAKGYRSFFSERTAGLLKQLRNASGTAYVDLHDRRRQLSGATSSCGSAEFLSQIQRTLAEFPTVDRVIFAIEGDPRLFYDWMELECNETNEHCDSRQLR